MTELEAQKNFSSTKLCKICKILILGGANQNVAEIKMTAFQNFSLKLKLIRVGTKQWQGLCNDFL